MFTNDPLHFRAWERLQMSAGSWECWTRCPDHPGLVTAATHVRIRRPAAQSLGNRVQDMDGSSSWSKFICYSSLMSCFFPGLVMFSYNT